jgi:site-specific DNA-cytosine methylase
MLAAGARVVLVDRDEAQLTKLQKELGAAVIPLALDLLDPKSCASMKPSMNGRRALRPARNVVRLSGPWESRPLYSARRAPDTLTRAERAIAELGRGEPFLVVYYGSDGSGGWQTLDRPLRTLTTLDRFGLVTWQGRTPMLRMLQVPELKRAMGFCSDYKLPYGTRRDQIKILGNGVCPPVMESIIRTLTVNNLRGITLPN